MRDFFWYFSLALALYLVGDYYTTAKTVSIATHADADQDTSNSFTFSPSLFFISEAN